MATPLHYALVLSALVVAINPISKVESAPTLSENFEGGTLPDGWVTYDEDGLTPHSSVSQFTEAWIVMDEFDNPSNGVAASNSWYDPVGQSDDYLISPQVFIAFGDQLSWMAEAQDPSYPDAYEVRVSNTTQDPAGCLANPPLLVVPVEDNPWRSRRASLSDYHYQNVFICFRNISNDEFVLQIDDILIGQPPQFSIRSGYMKLDTIGDSSPPGPDCAGAQHYGRMAVDEINGGLHVCAETGWMYIPAGPVSMSNTSTQGSISPDVNTDIDSSITRSELSIGEGGE